jgi:hypothetical protein
LIAWKLIVSIVIPVITVAAVMNSKSSSGTRYAKPFNQLFMAHHEIGAAIRMATNTGFKKSLVSITNML